jgi:hypothetical protein
MMGILAAITGSTVIQGLVVYLISDKGGSWLTNILSKNGWLGYGTKAAKAVAQNRLDENAVKAREEKLDWLEAQMASLEKQKKEIDGA